MISNTKYYIHDFKVNESTVDIDYCLSDDWTDFENGWLEGYELAMNEEVIEIEDVTGFIQDNHLNVFEQNTVDEYTVDALTWFLYLDWKEKEGVLLGYISQGQPKWKL